MSKEKMTAKAVANLLLSIVPDDPGDQVKVRLSDLRCVANRQCGRVFMNTVLDMINLNYTAYVIATTVQLVPKPEESEPELYVVLLRCLKVYRAAAIERSEVKVSTKLLPYEIVTVKHKASSQQQERK